MPMFRMNVLAHLDRWRRQRPRNNRLMFNGTRSFLHTANITKSSCNVINDLWNYLWEGKIALEFYAEIFSLRRTFSIRQFSKSDKFPTRHLQRFLLYKESPNTRAGIRLSGEFLSFYNIILLILFL